MVVSSTVAALALMLLSMTCWGSWANTYKLAGNIRFELFYWDYAIGLAVTAIALAWYNDGSALLTELTNASADTLWEAIGAGAIFNLANLLLVAAIALAGLAVAFPLGIGVRW
jgi:glucose uptake protein